MFAPSEVETHTSDVVKFDAVMGCWETRVLHGVSREALAEYCKAKGLRIDTDRAIGITYREVLLVKV